MSLSVDDYVNAVPEKDRYMLDMVVDFKEKYRDGSMKEDHLIELSEVMDCWDGEVARSLELGPPTQAAIRRENSSFEDQKLATLRKWREYWKEEATYKNLIKCFLKAKKTSWAAYVRDMFRDPDAGPPDSTASRGHVEVLPSPGTTVLGEDHFKEVLDLLWSARSNYTNLGYALGLPVGTMAAIPQSNFYNVDRCFESVLREVLIRGVTQEELACGLESKTLNYGQLAVIVRNHKFKTSSAASSKSPQRPSNPEPLRPTPPHSSKDVVSHVRHPPPQASDPSMSDCDSPSDSVDFSESMGVDDLAKWLLQKFGRDYNKDIDKLKSAGVNGRAFLKLPSKPDLREKIGLSFVFEDIISDEIKLLHPSPKPDSDKRKCSSSMSSDEECEQDNLVCNILQNRSDQSSTSDDVDRDTRSAFVPTDLAWTGHTQLRVKMLTEIPPGWTYCGDPLNIGNIISWANEWRGDNIPEFVLARGNQPAEVRLQFNNKGIRRSYIGTTAQSVGKTEPTMWLDLHTGHGVTDTYKKHIVVHEFGHVLGLTHEHQRSDFWLHVKPYIDVEKMKKDLKVTEKQFKLDWDVDCNNLDGAQTDYDPRSIMHYWFKLSWLTKGYSKKSKIQKDERDGNLSHQAAKILLGIHNNCSNPVNGPSKLDIHLLSVVYYQKPDSSDGSSADDIKKEPQVNVKSAGLAGVDVCAETTLIVTNNPQSFIWKGYGLKIHIPQGCLPEDVDKCTIKIQASLSGLYEFPHNLFLVSAVFWLRCEPQCKFSVSISMEIQHCARAVNVSKLSFVKAFCSQKSLPYTFGAVAGGCFSSSRSYGILELDSFSGVAVTQEGTEEREYMARLFYLNQTISSHDIHLVVTWNSEAHITVVEEVYCQKKQAQPGPEQPVDFESEQIKLDIPQKGVRSEDGWVITPLTVPVVTKSNVDKYKPRKMIPHCELSAEFESPTADTIVTRLLYQVKLLGAKEPYNMVTIKPPTIPTMSCMSFENISASQSTLKVQPVKSTISSTLAMESEVQCSEYASISLSQSSSAVASSQPQRAGHSSIPSGTFYQPTLDTALLLPHVHELTSTSPVTTVHTSGPHPPHTDTQASYRVTESDDLIDMSKPSSANLRVIRWKNECGEVKKFHLKSEVFHKWRRIGDLVASRQQVEVWSREMNSEDCCDAVLSQWLDHPPRHYPATWEGFCELLDDCELGEVASELKLAVSNAV